MRTLSKIRMGIGLITIVVILGIAVYFSSRPQGVPSTDTSSSDFQGGPAQNFTFTMPDDWKYITHARKDVQTIIPGQQLAFGIVNDPSDLNRAYFATKTTDPKDQTQSLFGIYAYDTSNYTFERVYRVSYGSAHQLSGIDSDQIDLHAIGYDSQLGSTYAPRLIILAQDADNSPGPCTEVYTLGRDASDKAFEMLSLNLADPFAKGLEPYRVPDDVYNAALDKQNACANNLK